MPPTGRRHNGFERAKIILLGVERASYFYRNDESARTGLARHAPSIHRGRRLVAQMFIVWTRTTAKVASGQ